MADELIIFLASFLVWLMFFGLLVLWFIDGRIKKEQVLHALFASFFAFSAAEILKRIFNTPRPFVMNNLQTYTLTTPNDPAFPSSHAAVVFALAFTIFFHDRKVGIIFLILAILVGWARVAANVHYPIDILGGAFIGTITAILIEKVHVSFGRLKKRVLRY